MSDKTKDNHEKLIYSFQKQVSLTLLPQNLVCLLCFSLSSSDLSYAFTYSAASLPSECCLKHSLIFILIQSTHYDMLMCVSQQRARAGCPVSWSSCRALTPLLWTCCRETSNAAPCRSRTQTLPRTLLINQKSFILIISWNVIVSVWELYKKALKFLEGCLHSSVLFESLLHGPLHTSYEAFVWVIMKTDTAK